MNPEIARLITLYQKENDQEALMALWQAFQPLVINSMQKFYVTSGKWDDVSQEAFLKLLEVAQTYDMTKGVPFESYFKMQLHYWFLGGMRKKTELLVVDHNWSQGISMTNLMESTMGNAQELLETNDRARKVHLALKTLTQKQRKAVTMFYFQGITLGEIAKEMSCSYNVAYKHKAIALKKIKKHILSL